MQRKLARIRHYRTLVATLIFITATTLLGQSAATSTNPPTDETTKLPAFEVATIKPVNPNGGRIVGFLSYPGGRVIVGYAKVQMLLYYAFNVQDYQISGGPDWVNKDRYNIEALPPDSSPSRLQKATPFIANPSDEQRKMILSLLVDRFGLKYHREIKEGPVFLLTRDSKTLQMQPPKDPDADPRAILTVWQGGIIDGDAVGINTSMPYLASRLSDYLHRTVLDQTGLKGSYDFHVDPYDPTNTDITSAAIESLKRIGLKLKAGKGPVETIVIDSVTRPTEN
jgi:uncharacterized protein (TIGR03435 family)